MVPLCAFNFCSRSVSFSYFSFTSSSFFFFYLTLRMNSLEEKKLAVLTEISENSRTLFAMARSASARAERDYAWKTVCDFAHTVGLTASVFDGA